MDFPKGTCVVLMRHAESEWNRERFRAFKRGNLAPARIPDKQDANLSPFGRMQAFLAGVYLRQLFAPGNGKPQCDTVAYSEFKRAEQTANWALRAAGLNPRYTAIAKELNEQSHAAIVPPDLAVLLSRCMDIADSGSMDPNHADLIRMVLNALSNPQSMPFPAPLLSRPTPTYGMEIGLYVNFVEALRRNVIRHEVSRLHGEAQRKAWLKAFATSIRSTFRMAGNQGMLAAVFEDATSDRDRRKTVMGEGFLNLVPRAEFILRHLKTRADFYGERRFLVVSHSKICIAIRMLLEDLEDYEVSRMLTAEGPPFPPYVGMTVYRAHEGKLTLEGAPYRLPPLLSLDGRALEVTTPDDPVIEVALRVTGTSMRRCRRGGRSDGRPRRVKLEFEDSGGPRLAVASSPYSIVAPQRNSEPPRTE